MIILPQNKPSNSIFILFLFSLFFCVFKELAGFRERLPFSSPFIYLLQSPPAKATPFLKNLSTKLKQYIAVIFYSSKWPIIFRDSFHHVYLMTNWPLCVHPFCTLRQSLQIPVEHLQLYLYLTTGNRALWPLLIRAYEGGLKRKIYPPTLYGGFSKSLLLREHKWLSLLLYLVKSLWTHRGLFWAILFKAQWWNTSHITSGRDFRCDYQNILKIRNRSEWEQGRKI